MTKMSRNKPKRHTVKKTKRKRPKAVLTERVATRPQQGQNSKNFKFRKISKFNKIIIFNNCLGWVTELIVCFLVESR